MFYIFAALSWPSQPSHPAGDSSAGLPSHLEAQRGDKEMVLDS